MSHARHINRRCRTPSVLLESVKSVSSLVEFGPPSSLLASCASVQTRRLPRLQPIQVNPSQSKSIQPNPMKRLASTTSGSNPFRPLKNSFSTPIYPCFRDGSFKPFQGESSRIKANQAYFPARPPYPVSTTLRHLTVRYSAFPRFPSFLIFHSAFLISPVCVL